MNLTALFRAFLCLWDNKTAECWNGFTMLCLPAKQILEPGSYCKTTTLLSTFSYSKPDCCPFWSHQRHSGKKSRRIITVPNREGWDPQQEEDCFPNGSKLVYYKCSECTTPSFTCTLFWSSMINISCISIIHKIYSNILYTIDRSYDMKYFTYGIQHFSTHTIYIP